MNENDKVGVFVGWFGNIFLDAVISDSTAVLLDIEYVLLRVKLSFPVPTRINLRPTDFFWFSILVGNVVDMEDN